jgi:hypothetical protein
VLLPANEYPPSSGLLLEVALQAQDMIALGQHSWIDRAMRLMTSRAALAHRLMLEHERAALRDVAFAAGLLLCGKRRPATDDGLPFVRIVAIGATHAPPGCHRFPVRSFQDRMSVRKTEFGALIEMALKADLR